MRSDRLSTGTLCARPWAAASQKGELGEQCIKDLIIDGARYNRPQAGPNPPCLFQIAFCSLSPKALTGRLVIIIQPHLPFLADSTYRGALYIFLLTLIQP